jgi:hypothetical protein
MSYESLDGVLPYAFDAVQNHALGVIGLRATDQVYEKYGAGGMWLGPIAMPKPYHGLLHTNNTVEDWDRLATADGMTPAERRLGHAMAAAHDVIQEGERGEREHASAIWLVNQLVHEGFAEPVTTLSLSGVKRTEPIMDADGTFTGRQKAHTMDYHSDLEAKLSTGLATADMGRLHASSSQLGACLLHEEVSGRDLASMVRFQRGQVKLVEEYEYPHPRGDQVFGRQRDFIAKHARLTLRRLEAEDFKSWNELVIDAERFARDYSFLERSR